MINEDILISEDFWKSEKFEKWHKSVLAIIEHAQKPAKDLIDNWEWSNGKPPEIEP